MKRFSWLVVALLFGSLLGLPGSVSAETGLQALLFVSPDDQTAGETVDVNLETYLDGVATDVDNISIGADPAFDDLTFTKTATGKYHATYDLTAADDTQGVATIAGQVEIGVVSHFVRDFYEMPTGDGWEAKVRVVERGLVPIEVSVGPGASVELEARSYFEGALTDAGPITMTADWVSAEGYGNVGPLTTTKVGPGVYRATLDVEESLSETHWFHITADVLYTSTAVTVTADPIPVMVSMPEPSTEPDVLDYVYSIYVGGDTPIEGAQVEVTGEKMSPTFPFEVTPQPTSTATTDANGKAEVTVENGLDEHSTWVMRVIAGDKKTVVDLGHGPLGGSGWVPAEPAPSGCDITLLTDPTGTPAGETATFTYYTSFAATAQDDREPLATTYVDRYVWGSGDSGTSAGGGTTTDADGNFEVSHFVDDDWSADDRLNVKVVCPTGDVAHDTISFFNPVSSSESKKVTVEASGTIGGDVEVSANYAGSLPLEGATAVAYIEPSSTYNGLYRTFPLNLMTKLTQSGSDFNGTIKMPNWLEPGDYVVTVTISTEGATLDRIDEMSLAQRIVIAMAAGTGDPTGDDPTGDDPTGDDPTGDNSTGDDPSGEDLSGGSEESGQTPGFEGVFAILAVAAVAAGMVVERRRRR